jgi:hypothetical protein
MVVIETNLLAVSVLFIEFLASDEKERNFSKFHLLSRVSGPKSFAWKNFDFERFPHPS